MKRKPFLVYLVEMVSSFFLLDILTDEWKHDKRVQYLVLFIVVSFFLVIGGGILIFNL